MAASGADATGNLFGLIDVVLRRLAEAAINEDLGDAEKICPSLVCSNNQRLSSYLLIGFVRANGDVVTYGPSVPHLNFADRDYFRAQKDGDAGLFVGPSRSTPFMAGPVMPVSRRLPLKDGSFQGIVVAAIATDQVRVALQGVGAGKADRIDLRDADGRSLVEWVAGGTDLPGGQGGNAAMRACVPTGVDAWTDVIAAAGKPKVGNLTVDVCRWNASALSSWSERLYLIAGAEALLLAASALAIPVIGRRRDDRLRQQRGLRGLVAGSSDVQFIIAATPDGRFVLEALTFTRGGELGRMSARLIGRTTREFFAAEDVDLIEADYRSVLASGQTRRVERLVHLGGVEFTWSTVLVPLSDAGGRGGYIYGAATELAGAGDGELEGGLRRFTENVLRREDAERRRIARELHDTTGQNLIAAGFELGVVERGLPGACPQVWAALAHARALVDTSVSELRTLAYVLHPALLDEAGLGVALPTLAEGFERRAGIRVDVTVADAVAGLRWAPETEIALYRVAQEALANVQRHSVTKAARVFLGEGVRGHLELVVDDGIGDGSADDNAVPPVVEGSGIRGMRDRLEALGGSLRVARQDGGIRVTATAPARAASP